MGGPGGDWSVNLTLTQKGSGAVLLLPPRAVFLADFQRVEKALACCRLPFLLEQTKNVSRWPVRSFREPAVAKPARLPCPPEAAVGPGLF